MSISKDESRKSESISMKKDLIKEPSVSLEKIDSHHHQHSSKLSSSLSKQESLHRDEQFSQKNLDESKNDSVGEFKLITELNPGEEFEKNDSLGNDYPHHSKDQSIASKHSKESLIKDEIRSLARRESKESSMNDENKSMNRRESKESSMKDEIRSMVRRESKDSSMKEGSLERRDSSEYQHSRNESKIAENLHSKRISKLTDEHGELEVISETSPKSLAEDKFEDPVYEKNTSRELELFQGPPKNHAQKMIRYKFEDLTLHEFQRRVQMKEALIREKIGTNAPIKSLLTQLMCSCRIIPRPDDIQLFPKELAKALSNISINKKKPKKKNLTAKNNEPSDRTNSLNYDTFYAALNTWYTIIHFPKDLKSKLALSIKDYENMKLKMLPNEDHTFIDSLISTLKSQLKKLNETSMKLNENYNIEERGRNGAHEIFIFYSRLLVTSGNTTIEHNNSQPEVLFLPKFLKFTRDFGVLEEHKNENKNRIKVATLEEIYDKNSNPKKDMHEYQFFQALEDISIVFFDEEYDGINKTHWKSLPDSEKIIKLYEILGFHEPSIYSKKVKANKLSPDYINTDRNTGNNTSKNTSFTPKTIVAPILYEKNQNRKIAEIESKDKKKFKDEPVTWEKLSKMENEADYDVLKYIDESSSNDELKGKNQIDSNSHKLASSISAKALKRAEELSKVGKKKEDERLKQIFKIADEKAEKNLRFTRNK